MQQQRGPCMGKVALVECGAAQRDQSCEQIVLDRALGHLAEASSRLARVEEAR
jgi:hypothetical protein